MRRGFDRRAAMFGMRPTKWIGLPGPLNGRPRSFGVLLAVPEHARPPLARIDLVRRCAAVHLMERALAHDRAHGDVRRRAEALVQLEIRVAAAGDGEALVEPADLGEQRPRDEHAVALPHAVEPVAVADEMTDLEEAVTGVRPADRFEQAILVLLVVAVAHDVALLAWADIPLLGRDDRGRVRVQAHDAEVQYAWGQHVGAVDHERERAPAALEDPRLSAVTGDGAASSPRSR